MKGKASFSLAVVLLCIAQTAPAFADASALIIEGVNDAVAGVEIDLTITAVDDAGEADRNYDGRRDLLFSGVPASPDPVVNPSVTDENGNPREFGSPTPIDFKKGIASVQGRGRNGVLRVYRAGTFSASVSDGLITSSGSGNLNLTVEPALLAGLDVNIASPQRVGVPLSGTNTIVARDAYGNVVTGFDASQDRVTVTSSLGGTVSGLGSAGSNVLDQPSDFVGGVSDPTSKLTYRGAPGNGTLLASASSGGNGISNSFEMAPAEAAKLRFVQQPTNSQPGRVISPPVTVQLLDDAENIAPQAGVAVTLTLTSGSGTLSGTATRTSNEAGVVTFDDLSIDQEGEKALAASGNNLSSATSIPFFILAPQATQLAFVQQPANTAAGVAITPAVTVQLKDAAGANVAIDGVSVTLALNGSGTLGGTLTRSTVGGLATFNDLTLTQVGQKSLTATSSGLTAATSQPFEVTPGAPSKLVFVQQPSAVAVGAVINPVVTVHVRDAFDNNVSTAGISVSMSLAMGTGTLGGTTTQGTGSDGVASFNNLSVDAPGEKTLSATSQGLPSATSQPFTVTGGTPARLVIRRQPSGNAVAGTPFARQPIIEIVDDAGNVVSNDNSTVVNVQEGPGGPGGLQGTTSVTAVNGVATFTNLAETKAATIRLQFGSNNGLPAVTSSSIDVSPAAASKLVFIQQPSNASARVDIDPPVTIQLRDAFDNDVRTFGVAVTISLSSGTGTLTGDTRDNTNLSGLANFGRLRIDAAGQKVLTASANGLTPAVSNPFTISAAGPSELAFVQQPTNVAVGAVITPAVTVQLKDEAGNNVTASGVTVTMTLSGSGTLGGTLSRTTSNGLATFNNLTVSQTGNKQLVAASSGLRSATSQSFAVTSGSATRLVIQRQPSSSAVAGVAFGQQPVIAIVDAAGNVVGSDNTTTVTVRESSGDGGLQGTTSVKAVNGVVSFTNLALTKAGTRTLEFSSQPSLTGVTSNNINVTPAAPSKLLFVQQPTNAAAGAAISPPVTVQLRDAFDNVVAAPGVSVTMSLSSGSGTLSGTPTRSTNSAGLARFEDLSINAAGQKALRASSAGLTSAVSSSFTIGAGAASALAFAQQPTNSAAGGTITPAVTVQLKDAGGNNVTTNGVEVALTLEGTGTLNGTLSRPTVNGLATFSDLSVTQAGQKRLTASRAGLQSATSQTFTVSAGTATQLAFLQQPGNVTAGSPLTPAITVRIVDLNSNTVDVNGTPVTLSAAGGDTLGGTLTKNTVNGIATFDDIQLRRAGEKTLVASSPGLPAVSSAAFTVAPGSATLLSIETAPGGTGSALGAQNVPSGSSVTAYAVTRDAYNNFIANVAADSWALQSMTGGVVATDLVPSADKKSAQFNGHAAGSTRIAASVSGLPAGLTGILTVTAGTQASRITVETEPDGSGTVIGDRTLTAGSTLKVYAISRDASNNFLENIVASQWNVLDATGGIVPQDLAPSPDKKSATFTARLIGQARLQAVAAGINGTRSGIMTVVAGAASRLEAVNGTPQETPVNSEFGERLIAKVTDSFSNPVGGATVTFTLPATGPGGSFRGGNNNAISDAEGIATSAVLVANSFSGSFVVTAATQGAGNSVTFSLTNQSGSGANIAVTEGAAQSAVVGTAFAVQFKVLVKDDAGNPVGGALVRFSAPTSGPSGNFPGGLADSTRTSATGEATSSRFTANFVAGSFSVVASTETGKTVTLHLTNTPGPLSKFAVETGSGGRIDTQYVGVPFTIRIRALDAYENAVTSFADGIVISSTGDLSVGAGVTPRFVSGVLASHTVAFQKTGTFTIVAARVGGGASGTSNSFIVGNPRPVVTKLSPSSGSPGQTLLVNILGHGFLLGVTSVSFGDGIATQTVIESDTLITVTLQIDNSVVPGSRDVTIINTPPVGGVAFLANGFTVGDHPSPTLTSINPASGAQFESLWLLVRGANFLGNGFSHLSFSGEGITVDSISVDSSSVIRASIRISATAAVGPRDIIIVNDGPGGGSDTLRNAFMVTAGVLAAPSLVQPPNGAQSVGSTLMLTWDPSAGASKYRVEVATDPGFRNLIVADSTESTSYQVGPLTSPAVYYWHVRSMNGAGISAWSPAWSFDNLPPAQQTISLNTVMNFPDHPSPTDYAPTDYRIVGLPGASNTRLTNFIPGSQDVDWRIYWDNGGAGNYLIPFDGSATFVFSPGRAFWMLKKGPWTVNNVTISAAPVDSLTRSVIVPIHSGWNLISNPLMWNITWADIQAANGTNEPIYRFDGLYSRSDSFEPYIGYYFFNDPASPLEGLKIPYRPGLGKEVIVQSEVADPDSWMLELDLRLGEYTDRSTSLGVSRLAGSGKDSLDYRRPRSFGDLPSVYFARPEWDSLYSTFASDIRPPFHDKGSWKLEVASKGLETGEMELAFRELERVPPGMQVYLVDDAGAMFRDLRKEGPAYRFVPQSPLTTFRVLVGTQEALAEELAGIVPKTFALDQNYPNPFNPSTSIPVSLPARSDVELKIYNLLGQEVKTLHAGALDPGRHLFLWDGTNNLGSSVASGVYISRLTSGNEVRLGRKMLLMR